MSRTLMENVRIEYVKRKRNDLDYTLEQVLPLFKNPQVSWSGGKCSTVALHMTLSLKPDIMVFYVNTGVDYPETYQYIKTMQKLYGFKLYMIHPQTTFWKVVAKHGFPKRRHMGCEKAMKGEPAVPKCCILLKEKPLKHYLHHLRVDLNITGLRAGESRVRMFNTAQRGMIYHTQNYGCVTFHPIIMWTHQQVADYLSLHNIPVNPVYAAGAQRQGCWTCTAYKGWQESLRKTHPKMHKFLMQKYGTPTLDDYIIDFEPVSPM